MTSAAMHRCPLTLLTLLISLIPIGSWQAQPNDDWAPSTKRKVARIELARSIRAFAASTLANGNCLVSRGRLSQSQANQAMAIALREMGISPAVLSNPQVINAAGMVTPYLDSDCSISSLDDENALKLIKDEL